MKNYKQFFFALCLLFAAYLTSPAQNQQKVDSLLNVLKVAKEDTNKVNILRKLSWEYSLFSPLKAIDYGQQANRLANGIGFLRGVAGSLADIGNAYSQQANYDKSLEYLNQALEISKKMNNKKNVALALNSIGNVYLTAGDNLNALNYFLKALPIMEENNLYNERAAILNNIGIIYYKTQQYDKAIQQYEIALEVNRKSGNKDWEAKNLFGMGNVFLEKKMYEKALGYYNQSLKINYQLKNRLSIAHNILTIGIVYKKQDDFKKAISYYSEALLIYDTLNSINGQAIVLTNIGSIYYSEKKYALAIENLEKSIVLYKKSKPNMNLTKVYLSLSECYSMMNNYEQAYKHYVLYTNLKDSFINETTTKQIAELQTKYETEKKEKEIKVLTQQAQILNLENTKNKYTIYGLSGIALLLIVVSILFIRQQKIKAARRAVELEQKLLRSQMNPHFIFNSLNAIQNFVYSNNVKESAKYLSSFAKLMRIILENSREETVALEKEINMAEIYIKLQQLRFDNKFDYTIHVDPEIDTDNVVIPPMLIQPFIENAIEHGFGTKVTKGKLKLSILHENNNIKIEIEDDGIGIKKSQEEKQGRQIEHRSFATIITKERIAAYNKKHRSPIKFYIIDNEDMGKQGTKVILNIPYHTKFNLKVA